MYYMKGGREIDVSKTAGIGVFHHDDTIVITNERVQVLDDCGMGKRGQNGHLHRTRTEYTLPYQCALRTLAVAAKGEYGTA